MIAYKMFTKRKDGTLGPLFINKSQRIQIGEWLKSEPHETKNYAYRPGWHTLEKPFAFHLKERPDRVWCEVEIEDFETHERPYHQGGVWYLASWIRVIRELSKQESKVLLDRWIEKREEEQRIRSEQLEAERQAELSQKNKRRVEREQTKIECEMEAWRKLVRKRREMVGAHNAERMMERHCDLPPNVVRAIEDSMDYSIEGLSYEDELNLAYRDLEVVD